jgi:hypothetical protein
MRREPTTPIERLKAWKEIEYDMRNMTGDKYNASQIKRWSIKCLNAYNIVCKHLVKLHILESLLLK